MLRPLLLGFAFLILTYYTATAQAPTTTLPKWMTPQERQLLDSYERPESRDIPAPPSVPVRTAAEWEEIQALVITWTGFPGILREITRHASQECEVIIVTTNPTSVQNYLASGGVSLDNVTLLQEPFNTIWIRDYGQHSVYSGEVDSLKLIDWIYNRPRPSDDVIPDAVGALLGYDVYGTTAAPNDLVSTGGNFMSDGLGTAFSSELVLEENEPGNPFGVTVKTEAQIDDILTDYMGITRYIKMPTLPYDGIHHIDMHMKLLDEETLLVGEYPAGVADGPQIEANLQYVLDNFNSSFGTPYKVVRIPMPPDAQGYYPNQWGDYRTYTNSVFVNKTVLVPVYEEQYDTTALRILREALPGYKVVGIECNDIIQLSGALHCITKAVGVADPLRIVHQAIPDQAQPADFTIDATVQHRSGIASATVWYTTDTLAGYQSVPMSFTDAATDTWSAVIPEQVGDELFYYIAAEAVSGKQQVRPMPAPAGYFRVSMSQAVSVSPVVSSGVALSSPTPNPSRGMTYVDVTLDRSQSVSLSLTDLLGRRVATIHGGELPAGEHRQWFDTGALAAGVYLVSLECEGLPARQVKVVVR